MLGFLKGTTDAAFAGIDMLNPLITQMDDNNKKIATTLLDAGYSQKEIQRFVDVSSTQFEEWIELEIKVRERVAAATPLEVTEPTVEVTVNKPKVV